MNTKDIRRKLTRHKKMKLKSGVVLVGCFIAQVAVIGERLTIEEFNVNYVLSRTVNNKGQNVRYNYKLINSIIRLRLRDYLKRMRHEKKHIV